jgi:hypothetical protein
MNFAEENVIKSILQKFQRYFDRLPLYERYEQINEFISWSYTIEDLTFQSHILGLNQSYKWETLLIYYNSDDCKKLIKLIEKIIKN